VAWGHECDENGREGLTAMLDWLGNRETLQILGFRVRAEGIGGSVIEEIGWLKTYFDGVRGMPHIC